ncbi:MAG: type II toxin-antitoxin system VapC family toxin [Pseudomonadota bacterium]
MIFFDTNVVSELMKPCPDSTVEAWFKVQSPASIRVSVIVSAEIEAGIARLPAGKRKSDIAQVAERVLNMLGGHFVPVDLEHVVPFGRVSALKRSHGRRFAPLDNLIAATVLAANATLATRNTKDFEGLGIDLINPWEFQGTAA